MMNVYDKQYFSHAFRYVRNIPLTLFNIFEIFQPFEFYWNYCIFVFEFPILRKCEQNDKMTIHWISFQLTDLQQKNKPRNNCVKENGREIFKSIQASSTFLHTFLMAHIKAHLAADVLSCRWLLSCHHHF